MCNFLIPSVFGAEMALPYWSSWNAIMSGPGIIESTMLVGHSTFWAFILLWLDSLGSRLFCVNAPALTAAQWFGVAVYYMQNSFYNLMLRPKSVAPCL
ncbi:hypothetical protein Nepgr_033540 [Nepenthes gracilis]|uniref:Uncharacterized protein n=1 Tax=Nepenthes gracilis TaxID=150966 RepID=A0AAD3Y913_NEPGR|nr:hypothetical protein Nepgr_033540 [Nepenthes gracilis]